MVAAEREPLTGDAMMRHLMQTRRPLNLEETNQLLLYMQSMLDQFFFEADRNIAPDGLRDRLDDCCKVLTRIRNSSVKPIQIAFVIEAVLNILQRGVNAESPMPCSVLAPTLCLLHTLCWCSVDSSNEGQRQRLALEDEAFASLVAKQCTEPVCAILLEQHAQSRSLAWHACGSLMMIYKFRPHTRFVLQAVAAATAVLQTYGAASARDSNDSADSNFDAAVVSNACALLWVVSSREQSVSVDLCEDPHLQHAHGSPSAVYGPAVQIVWAQLERDPQETARLMMQQQDPAVHEHTILNVTEAAWHFLNGANNGALNPHRWGDEKERKRALMLATRALSTYQDAAGLAQAACTAIAQIVRQGLSEYSEKCSPAVSPAERNVPSGGAWSSAPEPASASLIPAAAAGVIRCRHAQQQEDMGEWGSCECEQCLGGRETLGLVQRAMTRFVKNDGVSAGALEALHALCLAHAPNVRRALRLGLIPALTATLTGNVRCLRVTAAAAKLLQALVSTRGGEALTAAAAEAVTAEVRRCCLLASSRIAVVEAEDVARWGLVAGVVTALRLHAASASSPATPLAVHGGSTGADTSIVIALLCVVRRWAWDHTLRAVLGKEGACELLFDMLALHGSKRQLAEITLAGLHALAWNADNKQRMAQVRVSIRQPLAGGASSPPEDTGVLRLGGGWGAPSGISGATETEEAMSLVVRVLLRFPRGVELQSEGIGLLSIISYYSDANKALVHRSGGIAALVAAMLKNKESAQVQEQACLGIWSLATSSLNTDEARKPQPPTPQKGGKPAPPTPQRPPPPPAAHADVQRAILEAKANAEERGKAIGKDGIEALLLALYLHRANALICERAARALVVLAFENKNRSRTIYNGVGGLEILRGALHAHEKHAHVLEQLAAVLKNVCGSLFLEEADQKVDMRELLPCALALVQSVQRHIPEANLLKQAFAALGNVALNMHTNAQLPVTVVDVFLLGLEQHRHDPEVQQRGMKAMFNLAGKPKGAPNHGPAGRALAKKEMQCGVLFSSVANVLRWHGQDAGLVFLALKLLGKFSEATGVQMAAKIIAPCITAYSDGEGTASLNFAERMAHNTQRDRAQRDSSEWGKKCPDILLLWNELVKKKLVAPLAK